MNQISALAIFCGSGEGKNPIFRDTAISVGEYLAEAGISLVYGGASIGIMGAAANGCLSKFGKVIGVIPSFMDSKEIIHENLTELVRVGTMHERKLLMYEKADAIIALPGGFGTLDELFETLTWVQLGLHIKPVGILNTNGYYDALIEQMKRMVEDGFLRAVDFNRICISDDFDELMDQLRSSDLKAIVPVIDRNRV